MSRRMKKLTENVSVQRPCRIDDHVLERHDEPHAVDDAERNLKRILRSLAFDDARARIEGMILGDEGKLAVRSKSC